ncbi:MAG TPA: PA2169 family four-helix-bundle protein [Novosphingobium sp.]|nr:PA2169 family four-helix-bundle protein [Novosphingobium sp.]
MAQTGDIETLNTLITTLIDSVDGYETSAGDIRDPALSRRFTERAQERRRAVNRLQETVRRLGGNPADDGSLTGGAHRAFVNLKQAVTGSDDKAIVNEVERGEDYLKGKFEAALKDDDLSGEGRGAVQDAWESVRSGHDEMSQLKHSMGS